MIIAAKAGRIIADKTASASDNEPVAMATGSFCFCRTQHGEPDNSLTSVNRSASARLTHGSVVVRRMVR